MKRPDPSVLVIAAGVAAALHVGKLAPALPALKDSLGIGLVEAGFLISMVQFAGLLLGLLVGLLADTLGLRRTMVTGLVLLSLAGAAGGWAQDSQSLLLLRALEGLGFLLATMPAPSLVRRLVEPARLQRRLGWWGAFMPLGTAAALLFGPWVVGAWRWPAWWWLVAALSGAMAAALVLWVPADGPRISRAMPVGWRQRLAETLTHGGPWLLALAFAVYSAQWLAVIGFLPSIYAQAGLAPGAAGPLMALAAAVNMVGNIGAGGLLQRGIAPQRTLQAGYAAMALGAAMAFAPLWPAGLLSTTGPYVGVLLFSAFGGLVPGTLFSMAVRLAPSEQSVSTTVGWMQQWSAIGQFLGPPLVGWAAVRAGGWEFSWVVTVACAAIGMALAVAIGRRVLRIPPS